MDRFEHAQFIARGSGKAGGGRLRRIMVAGGAPLLVLVLAACSSPEIGDHITEIQTGKGFDQKEGTVTDESDSFKVGDTVHVVFTVETSDDSGSVVIRILRGDFLQDTSLPVAVQKGTNVYEKTIELHEKGEFMIAADYNSESEASIEITVE